MAKRNLYLNNVPVEEALSKYFSALEGLLVPKFEKGPVEKSLDRVTSSAVFAKLNSPLYNCAAMDGIAVTAGATNGGTIGASGVRESNPLVLNEGKDFIFVNTGDPIHHPYDAVIMAENLIQMGTDQNQCVKIMESVSPMQHIRPMGEDITAGEMIISERHRIRPIDIGVLFSGGVTDIEVFQKPKVAIFPTGSEIIEESVLKSGLNIPKEGAVIDSNTRMLEALVKQEGGEGIRFAPVPDDINLIKDAITKAAQEFDMVLINAGSSAGTEDFTVAALREIGEVIVHGVAMKPGKPVILAKVNGKPVIGTPGYPVSAYLSFEVFASPVLAVLTCRKKSAVQKTEAVLSKRIVSSLKHREYVRVKLEKVINDKPIASPLARGAGAAMSLVKADGFCVIDQQSEGIEAGEIVQIELLGGV